MLSQLFHNCAQHGFPNSRIHGKTQRIRQTISWTAQKPSFVHLENISIIPRGDYKEFLECNSSHFLDVLRKKSKQKKIMLKLFQIESSCWK